MNYSDIHIKEEEAKVYELTRENKQLQEKFFEMETQIELNKNKKPIINESDIEKNLLNENNELINLNSQLKDDNDIMINEIKQLELDYSNMYIIKEEEEKKLYKLATENNLLNEKITLME